MKLEQAIGLSRFDAPAGLNKVAIGLTVVGLAGFVGALFSDGDAAWRAFLANYFFWLGLSLGGVMWSVVMRITNARWGRSLMRFAEGTGFYLPIAAVLFLVLLVGGYTSHVYEWAHHAIEYKEVWLNRDFVFGRNTAYIFLLFLAVGYYLFHSLKSDVRVLKQANSASEFFQRFFSNAEGSQDEWQKSQNILVRFSPVLALLYGVLVSLIVFDLLMSLEPYWYSTMFGGFIFMGNLLCGMAFLALICGTVPGRSEGFRQLISKNQFWDVGKLLFAFTMIWIYLMWAQFLPAWYGNIHEEIGYVIKRTTGAYENLAWTVLAMVWIIPWWILLPKTLKWKPKVLSFAALIVLCGMWLQYWMIVVPAQFGHAPVSLGEAIYPGWIDGLTNMLFAGLFLGAYSFFLRNIPVLPVGDAVFQDVLEHGSHHH